jgi:hypothetical protein
MAIMIINFGIMLIILALLIFLGAFLVVSTCEIIEDDREWKRWNEEKYGNLKFTRGSSRQA